jgi:holliday junction DNA helicase RuvA
VLELKDKLDDLAGSAPASASATPALGATEEDVLSALVNLGYQRPIAQKAVESAAKDSAVAGDFEKLFRAAMSAVR